MTCSVPGMPCEPSCLSSLQAESQGACPQFCLLPVEFNQRLHIPRTTQASEGPGPWPVDTRPTWPSDTYHSLEVVAELAHKQVQPGKLIHHAAQLSTGMLAHLWSRLQTLTRVGRSDVRAQVQCLCVFTDGIDFSWRGQW